MPEYTVRSMAELGDLLARHQAARVRRVKTAIKKTARRGARIVEDHVPRAFGELAESVHVDERRIIVDAPHAAAVNNGSRPHLVPLEPLIRWVKLRGMQGLQSRGVGVRGGKRGPTTRKHAKRIAAELRGMESGGALDINAPAQIARAIQASILKRGTKPYAYAPKSLPEIYRYLDSAVKAALPDRERKPSRGFT